MYSELSDAGLAALLGLTGLIPFVHTNTVIQFVTSLKFADLGLFAVILVFSRIPFELIANAKLNLAGEQTAFSLDALKGASDFKVIFTHVAGAMVLSLLLFPFYSLIGKAVAKTIAPFIPFALLALFSWFVASQKNKTAALLVACLAGVTGVVVLDKNVPNSLFILLTGLYALPLLFEKEAGQNAGQTAAQPALQFTKPELKLVVVGSLIGMSSAFLPATTPAMLTITFLSFMANGDLNKFALLNSSVIGSRAVSDFAALEFLGKARSGAAATMLEQRSYNFAEIYQYLFIGILAALAAMLLALKFSKYIPTINSFKVKALLAMVIFAFTFFTGGITSLAGLALCTLVGLTAMEFKVPRSNLGSCILFPAVLNYL